MPGTGTAAHGAHLPLLPQACVARWPHQGHQVGQALGQPARTGAHASPSVSSLGQALALRPGSPGASAARRGRGLPPPLTAARPAWIAF